MDWPCRRLSIAETLRLGRTLARERNRAGCLVPGLGLGRRDSYRYQSITLAEACANQYRGVLKIGRAPV